MKKKAIILSIIVVLLIAILVVAESVKSKKTENLKEIRKNEEEKSSKSNEEIIYRKVPADGDDFFNLHCNRITIYVDDKVVVELKDKEKENLLNYFSNNAFLDDYDVDTKIDDTYNIKVDFNNGITILYMRKDDNYTYFSKRFNDNFRYELKDEVHDKIMNLIEKNQ